MNIEGNDIRNTNLPVSSDVVGTIMQFLPQEDILEIAKQKSIYTKKALLYGKFNLENEKVCFSFSKSDLALLRINKFIDQYFLLLCAIKNQYEDIALNIYMKGNFDFDENRTLSDLFLNVGYYGHLNLFKMIIKLQILKVKPINIFNWVIDGHYWFGFRQNQNLIMLDILLKDKRFNTIVKNDNIIIDLAIDVKDDIIIKILLKDGRSDPNKALLYSISSPYLISIDEINIIKLLLKDKRIDFENYVFDGFNLAIRKNKINAAKVILNNKKFKPMEYNINDISNSIIIAAKKGYIGAVLFGLSVVGYNIDSEISDPKYIQMFLVPAIRSNNLDLIKLLIENFNARPWESDPSTHRTPIMVASSRGNPEIIKYLFQFEKVKNKMSSTQIKKIESQI